LAHHGGHLQVVLL